MVIRTPLEVDVGEFVEIGRVVDTFDLDVNGGRPVSDMIPVYSMEKHVLLDLADPV